MAMEKKSPKIRLLILICLFAFLPTAGAGTLVVDSRGGTLYFDRPPTRVVSLVPAATEIICSLGAEHALVGVTLYSNVPVDKRLTAAVGSVQFPNLAAITALQPDLVFVSTLQEQTARALEQRKIKTLFFDTPSYNQNLENIRMMGKIFDRKPGAENRLAAIQAQIDRVRQKIDKIPEMDKKRVFCLMGQTHGAARSQTGSSGTSTMNGDGILTPGRRSFLNDLIVLAGGIPMAGTNVGAGKHHGKNGIDGPEEMVARVCLDQWKTFNPQVIFGGTHDKKTGEAIFQRPGWDSVDGVKQGKIYYFPQELTTRAGCNTGLFVQWLASFIYSDLLFTPETQVRPDTMIGAEPVAIDLDIVKKSERIELCLADFTHKTLVIDFNASQTVLSTLEGLKDNILTLANHYLPPPSWTMPHTTGIGGTKDRILTILGRNPETTALLMTGADMAHLTVTEKKFNQMRAVAVVTAGVCSNAQRMSRDTGGFYEPGTINILVMTNMRLSHRAMARAMITVTEAKTAALADLDIRSSFRGIDFQATGTGTDNIIVVQGQGVPIDNTGGHSKMGELIARAVHQGVTRAIFLQNHLAPGRNIFQRLGERGITPQTLALGSTPGTRRTMTQKLEALLMDPKYAGLVEMALALSDAEGRQQINDLTLFAGLAQSAGQTIAGQMLPSAQIFYTTKDLPPPLKLTFNWLMTGIEQQLIKE